MSLRNLTNRELVRHLRATDPDNALLDRFEGLLDEFDSANVELLTELDFSAQDLQSLRDAIGAEDIPDACAVLSACNDHNVPMPDAATLIETFSKTDFSTDECAELLTLLVALI